MGTFQDRVQATRKAADEVLRQPAADGSVGGEAQALTSIAHSALLIELHLASISSFLGDIRTVLEAMDRTGRA